MSILIQEASIFFYIPPNTTSALYIKANGQKYKLLDTEGIGNKAETTAAYHNKPFIFTAFFEALPKSVVRFDLNEGSNGSWHFYGVNLNNEEVDLMQKANKSRESAFEFLDLLLRENDKTGKWDLMYISLVQREIEQAIHYGIDDKEALLLNGWISYIGSEPEQAIRNYHYALSKFPDDPEIYYQMGNCFELSKKIDRAIYYWKKSGNDRAISKIEKYRN